MGSVAGDDDRCTHLDAGVHLNYVAVQHADAAKADGGPQLHPVGPGRSVDGVLACSDLHLGHVAHARSLSFKREDVILSEDFGEVRKGARVAMGTGTAEVVKISEEDHELSLRGPF